MPARLDYDQIAAWIHGDYVKANPDSVYVAFETLPEFLKADNRDAAIRMGQVLAMAGLRLEPRGSKKWPESDQGVVRQIIEDNIDLLAEAEHDGWVESRLRNNWRKGTTKDVENREHHLLVSYPEFPAQIARKQAIAAALEADGRPMSVDEEVEHEKEKDRQSVRRYVDIIARSDYRIVRET